MRPAQRIKQAEEVARRLKALLSGSIMSQLLQRTLPAALTAEQVAQLSSCWNVIDQLQAALDKAPALRLQLEDALLKQQVACNIGSLVTWVQQQPQQQLLDVRAVAETGQEGSAQVTWGGRFASIRSAGMLLLGRFAVAVLRDPEAAGACSVTANLTQQLDQSGKACSRNCQCTARLCCGRQNLSCLHD
jgi:hypothetical protein